MLAPMCLARPLLSPTVENQVIPLLPENRRDEVRANLHTLRDLLIRTLRGVRLPDTIPIGEVRILPDVATDFNAKIASVHIELDRLSLHQQGQLIVRLDMTDGAATVGGSPFSIGDFVVKFFYEPHIHDRSDFQARNSPAYSGLSATLVGVDVDGQIDIPFSPIDKDLSGAEPTLLGQLGPFSNQLLQSILNALGAMKADGSPELSRCLFIAPDKSGTLELPRLCPDGRYQEPHLVEVTPDEKLRITLRQCP